MLIAGCLCPVQCCGSGMFIPDPGSDFFPSRIRTVSIPDPGSSSKNLSTLTPKKAKKWFLISKKYYPGCSSRIPDPDADFLPSRIPDPDPQHWDSCWRAWFYRWARQSRGRRRRTRQSRTALRRTDRERYTTSFRKSSFVTFWCGFGSRSGSPDPYLWIMDLTPFFSDAIFFLIIFSYNLPTGTLS